MTKPNACTLWNLLETCLTCNSSPRVQRWAFCRKSAAHCCCLPFVTFTVWKSQMVADLLTLLCLCKNRLCKNRLGKFSPVKRWLQVVTVKSTNLGASYLWLLASNEVGLASFVCLGENYSLNNSVCMYVDRFCSPFRCNRSYLYRCRPVEDGPITLTLSPTNGSINHLLFYNSPDTHFMEAFLTKFILPTDGPMPIFKLSFFKWPTMKKRIKFHTQYWDKLFHPYRFLLAILSHVNGTDHQNSFKSRQKWSE